MSTNKLAQVIRKIVREEVRKEVRSLLNEQQTKKVIRKAPTTGLKEVLGLERSGNRSTVKRKQAKQYTKNATLNAILNETAGDIANGNASRLSQQADDYQTMGNGAFTSNNAHTFNKNSLASKMGYGGNTQTSTPTLDEMVPKTDVRGASTRNTQVDAGIAKALTRDYSGLVKKFKR